MYLRKEEKELVLELIPVKKEEFAITQQNLKYVKVKFSIFHTFSNERKEKLHYNITKECALFQGNNSIKIKFSLLEMRDIKRLQIHFSTIIFVQNSGNKIETPINKTFNCSEIIEYRAPDSSHTSKHKFLKKVRKQDVKVKVLNQKPRMYTFNKEKNMSINFTKIVSGIFVKYIHFNKFLASLDDNQISEQITSVLKQLFFDDIGNDSINAFG